MESGSETVAASQPEGPVILSFAAATGGLGTTLLTVNIGIQLAKKGRTVLVADMALAEACCHLGLGLLRPEKHLGNLVSKQVSEVEFAIVPTSVHNLALLAGYPDVPEVANLTYLAKQKIIQSLKALPFDYVLIDCGTGTGADTLDFFLAGDYPIAIVQATPVGVEPFYRFMRAALHRLLMDCLNKKRYQALSPQLDAGSPLSGLWDLQDTSEEDLSAVEQGIRSRRFSFIQTGLTSEKDVRMGNQIEFLVRRTFLCPVRFLGGVEWDAQASAAHKNLEPIAKAYPLCPFSLSVEKLANIILKEEKEPSPAEGHLNPRPLGDLNAYQILELPPNATVKEIQAAYSRILEPYLETSPLTLSLIAREERETIRERLEDAYKTLVTTGLRQRYDEELIARGQMREDQRLSDYRELQTEPVHPQASPAAPGQVKEEKAARPDQPAEAILEEVKHFDGKGLKRVRELQGISIAEIVAETNIRSWYIESIEAERFDALPGLIYLKGFVRQIAQYLHLSPERVLSDYLDRYHAWKSRQAK